MENENVFTGKSVDEAILEGLIALGITRDEAEIEVIEEAGDFQLLDELKGVQWVYTHGWINLCAF